MPLSPFTAIDDWRAPPPEPRKVGWIAEHGFAHRGLHGPGAPENSPSAFAAAMAAGLGIECDVQRTGDGRAVVFHDWELDRLTEATGAVADRSCKALRGIALRGSADMIPSLSDVLNQVAGRVPLLIELKSRRDMPIVALCLTVWRALGRYGGDHAVMSFDPRVARWFSEHSPTTTRGLVVTEEGERGVAGQMRRRSAFWYARPDFLAYDIRDLPSRFADRQRARGFPVATWTVRSEADRLRALAHADAPIAEGDGLGAAH